MIRLPFLISLAIASLDWSTAPLVAFTEYDDKQTSAIFVKGEYSRVLPEFEAGPITRKGLFLRSNSRFYSLSEARATPKLAVDIGKTSPLAVRRRSNWSVSADGRILAVQSLAGAVVLFSIADATVLRVIQTSQLRHICGSKSLTPAPFEKGLLLDKTGERLAIALPGKLREPGSGTPSAITYLFDFTLQAVRTIGRGAPRMFLEGDRILLETFPSSPPVGLARQGRMYTFKGKRLTTVNGLARVAVTSGSPGGIIEYPGGSGRYSLVRWNQELRFESRSSVTNKLDPYRNSYPVYVAFN